MGARNTYERRVKMYKWEQYEQQKKELQKKLEDMRITSAEYRKALRQICKELKI